MEIQDQGQEPGKRKDKEEKMKGGSRVLYIGRETAAASC
jgi:hypothetical protein